MSLVVVTPPTDALVSLELAKAHLRVDSADEDALIGQHIAAATAAIDGPAGWLNRALGAQTLELRLPDFAIHPERERPRHGWPWRDQRRELALPCPPLRSIVSITYADPTGVDVVMDAALYRAVSLGVSPARGCAWPCTYGDADAVRIRFTAGYDAGAVPKPIVQAVLLMVGDLYANREAVVIDVGRTSMVLNPTADRLLDPFVHRCA